MLRKRLDVQIDEERFNYIKSESERTGKAMNVLSDELIAIGIAVKRGEVIEQQSLPVIREIINTELRKGFAFQREAIREDIVVELTGEIKAMNRNNTDRLAALIVKTLRDANIGRRLVYSVLAKGYGSDFAMKMYTDASEKAGRAIANRNGDDA